MYLLILQKFTTFLKNYWQKKIFSCIINFVECIHEEKMNITLNDYATGHKFSVPLNRTGIKSNMSYMSSIRDTSLQKDVFQRSDVSFGAKKSAKEPSEVSPETKLRLEGMAKGILPGNVSALEVIRKVQKPKLPLLLENIAYLEAVEEERFESVGNNTEIRALFPNIYDNPRITFRLTDKKHEQKPINVGVLFSGGQAPGGHNVVAGLYDGLKEVNPDSKLFGFIGGPGGLIKGRFKELTSDFIDKYRNTGGFHALGSDRTKIETEEQFRSVLEVCKKLGITVLNIIGGDDSATNAAMLSQWQRKWSKENDYEVQILHSNKTIDGDTKGVHHEMSFGFDTATKVYAEHVSAVCFDAASANKYTHVIRLMGRSASHVALEVALLTHPNITLISEEIKAKKMSLKQVVGEMAGIIRSRAERGINHNVILVPEGLIEFIPEMEDLLKSMKKIMPKLNDGTEKILPFMDKDEIVRNELAAEVVDAENAIVEARETGNNKVVSDAVSHRAQSMATFDLYESLPESIREELVNLGIDGHGNVEVSKINTEQFLMEMLKEKLKDVKSFKLAAPQFLAYEGRAAFPTKLDAKYTFAIGKTIAALAYAGKTGYSATVNNLAESSSNWTAGGVNLANLLHLEERKGKMKPVIKKALVDLKGAPFRVFEALRPIWAHTDDYQALGPIQFDGVHEVCDARPLTLQYEEMARKGTFEAFLRIVKKGAKRAKI